MLFRSLQPLANLRLSIQLAVNTANAGNLAAADFTAPSGKMFLVGEALKALPAGTVINGEFVSGTDVDNALLMFSYLDVAGTDIILAAINNKNFSSFTQLVAAAMNAYNGLLVVNTDTELRYGSIQGAIDAAQTLTGHTIEVGTGIFYENITINKAGLTVKNGSSPVIDGGGSGIVVTITADNVTFTGFGVTGSGLIQPAAGIALINVTGCEISGNTVYSNLAGIVVAGGSGNTISGNTLNANGNAIALVNMGEVGGSVSIGSTSNTVEGNIITNSLQYGIWVAQNCNENEILDNNVSNSAGSGIFLWKAHDGLIQGNTSTGNSYGIEVFASEDVTITGNILTGNQKGVVLRTGVYGALEPATINAVITNNNISGNTNSAIDASENQGIEVAATCNWFGTEVASAIADMISGNVQYLPFLRVDNDYGDVEPWWSTDKYSCIGVGPVVVYDQDPLLPGTNIIGSHMTIQAAIDAASTLNGHYIAVSSGNYDELVNVTKEVTISGHGADNTLIEKISPAANANFITISASNVAIKDIAISGPTGGSTTRGIHIDGTRSNVSIVNVISQQHNHGIHVNAGSDITNLSLTNTVLNINGNGLQIDGGAKVDGLNITGGEISGNLFGLSVAAINDADNSDDLKNVTITGTEFKDNKVFGLMFNKGQAMTLTGLDRKSVV